MLWVLISRGASNEYSQHTFSSRNKKNIDIFGWKKHLIKSYVISVFCWKKKQQQKNKQIYLCRALRSYKSYIITLNIFAYSSSKHIMWHSLKSSYCCNSNVNPQCIFFFLAELGRYQYFFYWKDVFSTEMVYRYLSINLLKKCLAE